MTLYLKYQSCGELHAYPKCLDYADPEMSYVEGTGNRDYQTTTIINQSNAVKGKKYYSAKGGMASNRVLYFNKVDFAGHGGIVYCKISYLINGTAKTYDFTDASIYHK